MIWQRLQPITVASTISELNLPSCRARLIKDVSSRLGNTKVGDCILITCFLAQLTKGLEVELLSLLYNLGVKVVNCAYTIHLMTSP